MTSSTGNFFEFLGANNSVSFFRGLYLRSGDVVYPIYVNSLVPLVLSDSGEPVISVVLYIHTCSGESLHPLQHGKADVVTVRMFHQAKHLNSVTGAGNMDKIRLMNTFGKPMEYELVALQPKRTMRYETFCTAVLTGMTCLEKIFRWGIPVAPFLDILPPGWLQNQHTDHNANNSAPCIRIITYEWLARLMKLRHILDTRVNAQNCEEFARYAHQALNRSILVHSKPNDRLLVLLHKKFPVKNACPNLTHHLENGFLDPPQLRKGFSKRCKRWFYPMRQHYHLSSGQPQRTVFMSPLFSSSQVLMAIPFGQKRRGRPRKLVDDRGEDGEEDPEPYDDDVNDEDDADGEVEEDEEYSSSSKDSSANWKGKLADPVRSRNHADKKITKHKKKRNYVDKLLMKGAKHKRKGQDKQQVVKNLGKRRGRPPKILPSTEKKTTAVSRKSSPNGLPVSTLMSNVLGLVRRRGRPPKHVNSLSLKASSSTSSSTSKVPVVGANNTSLLAVKREKTEGNSSSSIELASAVVKLEDRKPDVATFVPIMKRGPGRPRKGDTGVPIRRSIHHQKPPKIMASSATLDDTISSLMAQMESGAQPFVATTVANTMTNKHSEVRSSSSISSFSHSVSSGSSSSSSSSSFLSSSSASSMPIATSITSSIANVTPLLEPNTSNPMIEHLHHIPTVSSSHRTDLVMQITPPFETSRACVPISSLSSSSSPYPPHLARSFNAPSVESVHPQNVAQLPKNGMIPPMSLVGHKRHIDGLVSTQNSSRKSSLQWQPQMVMLTNANSGVAAAGYVLQESTDYNLTGEKLPTDLRIHTPQSSALSSVIRHIHTPHNPSNALNNRTPTTTGSSQMIENPALPSIWSTRPLSKCLHPPDNYLNQLPSVETSSVTSFTNVSTCVTPSTSVPPSVVNLGQSPLTGTLVWTQPPQQSISLTPTPPRGAAQILFTPTDYPNGNNNNFLPNTLHLTKSSTNPATLSQQAPQPVLKPIGFTAGAPPPSLMTLQIAPAPGCATSGAASPSSFFLQPGATNATPTAFNCSMMPQPLHVQLQPTTATGNNTGGNAASSVQTPVIFYFHHHPGAAAQSPANAATIINRLVEQATQPTLNAPSSSSSSSPSPLILIPHHQQFSTTSSLAPH